MNVPYTMAVLDLGSNSFHMNIVKSEGKREVTIESFKEFVRLRSGLQDDGSLSETSQQRALACLARFEQRLRGIAPEHIRVVGTNTLRSAQDAPSFLRRIEETLKHPVDVIGGREEARLIYLGVAQNRPRSSERIMVIDIGGGSTELVLGQNMSPSAMESRSLGCVSFSLKFFPEGIVNPQNYQSAFLLASQELAPYTHTFSPQNRDLVIGTSGTIKSIATLLEQLGEAPDVITAVGIRKIYTLLTETQPPYPLPGLRQERVQVLPGGLAILDAIFEKFGIDHLKISLHGMREGIIYDFLGRGQNQDKRDETVVRLKKLFSVDPLQAKRVKTTALALLPFIQGCSCYERGNAEELLVWACELHEIGLAVAHSGYHKHGAYILLNGDLQGFSKTEQSILSFLIINHRKSIKSVKLSYSWQLDWPLLLVLRLAVIFNRDRVDRELPELHLVWEEACISISLPQPWLNKHPMTRFDLAAEIEYWKRIEIPKHIEVGNA